VDGTGAVRDPEGGDPGGEEAIGVAEPSGLDTIGRDARASELAADLEMEAEPSIERVFRVTPMLLIPRDEVKGLCVLDALLFEAEDRREAGAPIAVISFAGRGVLVKDDGNDPSVHEVEVLSEIRLLCFSRRT